MAQPLVPALDQKQLASIESVHRGFLYQHLYLAGALLSAGETGARVFVTEHDEDVEVVLEDAHIYLQIKTRGDQHLAPSDLKGLTERVAKLRAAHEAGEREGVASFYVLSNVPPGPKLRGQMAADTWPADLRVVWPGGPEGLPAGFPPVWLSTEEAYEWCVARAATVPGTRLEAATLVLKLAALAQAAAAGEAPAGQPHMFRAGELPVLFEQLAVELHAFPEAPVPYRPHRDEPLPNVGEVRVRVVTGLSGAGKTAWASQLAAASGRRTAYFDAAGMLGPEFATALAQQLLAGLLADVDGAVAAVYRPGASGLDSLRAISGELANRGTAALIVLDNVQDVPAEPLLQVLSAMPEVSWVLLGRPGRTVEQVAARLAVNPEPLLGWPEDTIAEVLAEAGTAVDRAVVANVLELTGGLPLFVRGVARLSASSYDGDLRRLCAELERAVQVERTPQEVLLEETLTNLSGIAKAIALVLTRAGTSLTPDEVDTLAATIGIQAAPDSRRGLRELLQSGVARTAAAGRVELHDAFRVPAVAAERPVTPEQDRALSQHILRLMDESIHQRYEGARVRRYLTLLPEAGEYQRLAEIAGNESEQLLEVGLARFAKNILEASAIRPEIPPEDKFWTLDAIAFWELEEKDLDRASERIAQMDAIAAENVLGPRTRIALLVKHVLLSAYQGDVGRLRALEREADAAGLAPAEARIVRYDIAAGLFMADEYEAVNQMTDRLIKEYYEVLGLRPEEVLGVNADVLAKRLQQAGRDPADAKRLGDSLDLRARGLSAQGLPARLCRLHAVKFYQLAGAFRSVMKTGQDFVDEVIGTLGDAPEALAFIENVLLRVAVGYELHDYVIPLRAQRAVILAMCGRIGEARAEMAAIEPYLAAASEGAKAEFLNQRRLVENLAAGRIRPPRPKLQIPAPVRGAAEPHPVRGADRNQPCPCGSGRKWKKCCGATRQRGS